jgi:hypothetical protein
MAATKNAEAAAQAASNGHRLVTFAELVSLPTPTEEVVIPELDVKVVLHAVTGTERQRLADLSAEDKTTADRLEFVNELIAAALGGDATPEAVAGLPGQVIDRMREAALRLTGFGAEAAEKVEEELKGTPNVATG